MFGRYAHRVIKRMWEGGAWPLAQELFAMFQDDIPLFHNAPVTITTDGSKAPLTVRQFGDGPLMDFQFGNRVYPGISVEAGELVFEGKAKKAESVPNPQGVPGGSGDGGGYKGPGKVVSGTGPNYQVDIYANGTGVASTATVTVRVANITSGTLTANDWINVFQLAEGGAYEGVASVWLQ